VFELVIDTYNLLIGIKKESISLQMMEIGFET